MGEGEEEGVYVGSGMFRVDMARLLEKLARSGYAHPRFALLGFVRCAVLGAASRIEIRGFTPPGFSLRGRDGVEIRFDGLGFSGDELRDPYRCLVESSAGRGRAVLLARALLTLAQSKPTELSLASGAAGERFELKLDGSGRETLRRVEGGGPTALRAVWEGGLLTGVDSLVQLQSLIDQRCRHCPVPIDLKNVWFPEPKNISRRSFPHKPPVARSAVYADFDEAGARGRVEMPVRIAPAASDIELYWAGVEVEQIRQEGLLSVPIDGFIDHLEFNLDLSAAAVVRDEQFSKAVEVLSRQAAGLAQRAARSQSAALEPLGPLLRSAGVRDAWTRTLDGRLLEDPVGSWWDRLFSSAAELEARRQAYWAAVRTRWLRYCARDARRRAPEIAAALFEAPLYLSTQGEPLSLAQLERLQQQFGNIPASPLFGLSSQRPVLWLSSSRDAALLPEGFSISRKAGRLED